MFSNRKNGWLALPNPRNSRALVLEKGKGKVVSVAETLPPLSPAPVAGETGEAEVWRRFREAGLLDEAALRRKDREALAERIEELERELYDYQYNMGLLLIEKKKWVSEYEEMRQSLSEAEGTLKREQTAHVIVTSDLEKQEENLQRALGIEKQRVKDLEKALHEMNAEIKDSKLALDKKLAQAHALEAHIEEKYMEIKSKLHSADAKLAEASRKSTDIDIKLEELVDCEHRLERKCSSFVAEKMACEEAFTRQREDLQAWEERLLEQHERIFEEQHFLNKRENKANECSSVKKNELLVGYEDISARPQTLEEADIKQMNLEQKERDLLALEEKLAARERADIQRVLDDHNVALDAKRQELELELEKQRKTMEKSLKDQLDAAVNKTNEINSREDQIFKREQALENIMEEKKKEIDMKLVALKERENSIQKHEDKLREGKEQLAADSQKLVASKLELESSRSAMEAREEEIIREEEKLKLIQSELVQEKSRFEREWEMLNEKRTMLAAEKQQLNDENERLTDWLRIEEEKLRNERVSIRRELEELRLKEEVFEKDRADFACELNRSIQIKQEKMEEKMQEKGFPGRRELEPNTDESHSLKLKIDQDRLTREKEELCIQRRKLEDDQLKMQTNIESLQRNLEAEREKFIKEREHFLAVAEQCKICKNCGISFGELNLLGLHIPIRNEVAESTILEEHVDGSQSIPLSGSIPLLQKCPMLFNSTPGRGAAHPAEGQGDINCGLDRPLSDGTVGNNRVSEGLDKDGDEPATSFGHIDTNLREIDGGSNCSPVRSQGKRDRDDSQTRPAKQRGGRHISRRGRPKTLKRTSSVEAVVEDAKAILGETSEENGQQANGGAEYLVDTGEGNQVDFVYDDQMITNAGQKRQFDHASKTMTGKLDYDDRELPSAKESAERSHKRHQTSSPLTPSAGEKRYNFRRSTIDSRYRTLKQQYVSSESDFSDSEIST